MHSTTQYGTVIAVGDSIAAGLAPFADQTYAKVGASLFSGTTDSNFAQATRAAGPGDTVIVSIGTNDWGLPEKNYEAYAATLKAHIDDITAKGAKVVILGVKETGYEGGGYTNTIGKGTRAQDINALLHESIRGNPNAVFSETSLEVANSITNGEVHGSYRERFDAALNDTGGTGAAPPHIATKSETTPTEAPVIPPTDPVDLSRDAIRAIQTALNQGGFESGASDGIIGNKTRGAWSRFEAGAGADGIMAREEIHQLFSGATLDELTSSREKTRQLQTLLNDLGYDSGNVDGIRGPITENAFKQFQDTIAQSTETQKPFDTLSPLTVASLPEPLSATLAK